MRELETAFGKAGGGVVSSGLVGGLKSLDLLGGCDSSDGGLRTMWRALLLLAAVPFAAPTSEIEFVGEPSSCVLVVTYNPWTQRLKEHRVQVLA